MRSFLGAALIYLLIKVALLAISIGVGFVLHWLLPAIDLGMGVLIGVVATGLSFAFFGRLVNLLNQDITEDLLEESAPRITYLIDPLPPRRRSKRKPS